MWVSHGRDFIGMSIMHTGACMLGYAEDEVGDAVRAAINRGVNSSLNRPEEGEDADGA
jgi:glutamate-1-semialdehyde 2,1-aminomutase